MREITLTISNNKITASDNFIGYQGEHNATILKFALPDNLQNQNYTYTANITLPDGITATATIADMSLTLTQTLTANAGIIQLQIVITEGNELVYKSGIANLTIKPSLAPTATIGNGSGITSVVVNDEGYLIVTLSDGKEVNAGCVKGDKGDTGDTYTISDEDKQAIANEISSDIIKGIIEHNITALEIPEGTTKISNYQFQGDKELRKIIIPDSVTEIGSFAFDGDFRLVSTGKLGCVTKIGDYAFVGCYSLTDIEFPETIASIGAYAFKNCYSLQNNGLNLLNCTRVGEQAFAGTKISGELNLTNCTAIGASAFEDCKFTGLKLSNKLASVNLYAFTGNSQLVDVDLGVDFNCNNLNLSVSTKYSTDTLVGILNSLKDRTGQTAYTLTLGSANLAKLTDEQKAIATNKNWILA